MRVKWKTKCIDSIFARISVEYVNQSQVDISKSKTHSKRRVYLTFGNVWPWINFVKIPVSVTAVFLKIRSFPRYLYSVSTKRKGFLTMSGKTGFSMESSVRFQIYRSAASCRRNATRAVRINTNPFLRDELRDESWTFSASRRDLPPDLIQTFSDLSLSTSKGKEVGQLLQVGRGGEKSWKIKIDNRFHSSVPYVSRRTRRCETSDQNARELLAAHGQPARSKVN